MTQSLIAALHHAADAYAAARALVDGLGAMGCRPTLALLKPGYGNVEIITYRPEVTEMPLTENGDGDAADKAGDSSLHAWLSAPDAEWQAWRAPLVIHINDENADALPSGIPDDLPMPAGTVFAPVGSFILHGLLVLQPPVVPTADSSVILLPSTTDLALWTALLEARLGYFNAERQWRASLTQARERDSAALTGLTEIGRGLMHMSELSSLWDTLFQHLNLLFDSTSFFVGILDPISGLLQLPLVVETGMRIDSDPIPLIGFSRAVIAHGVELYFQDVTAETARLEGLGIEADEREPGAWSLAWMGVPLRTRGGAVIGVIVIASDTPYSYDDGDLALLIAIASLVSLALENNRLAEGERTRRSVVTALMEMSQVITSTFDYDVALEQMLDALYRIIDIETSHLLLVVPNDADGKISRRAEDSGKSDKPYRLIMHTSSEGIAVRDELLIFPDDHPIRLAIDSRLPIVIGDTAQHPGWRNHAMLPHAQRVHSLIVVPMIAQGGVLGALVLEHHLPHHFTENDASIAFALARHGATAVEMTDIRTQYERAYTAQEERARRLLSMSEVTRVVTSSLNRDQVLQSATQLLYTLYDVDRCGIVLIDEAKYEGRVVAEYPPSEVVGMRLPLEGNETMRRLRQGEVLSLLNIDDGIDAPTREILQTAHARSTLIAPLIAQDQFLGSIALVLLEKSRIFTEEEKETFHTIAGQLALAFRNADLYEAAIDANRLKSEFLANVSHELRTPLNAIIGYSDMMLTGLYGDLNDKQIDRVERINRGGNHLLTLINDVLDLSKIDAGQIKVLVQALRASEIVRESANALLARASAKGLTVHVEVAPDEATVLIDPPYFQRALDNLLDNAVKFTEKGGVVVTITNATTHENIIQFEGKTQTLPPPSFDATGAVERIASGDWMLIRVADTGIGIAHEDQRIIFESFRQADGSSVRQFGGTGMGLALTRRLVSLHGGHLWVESTPGTGSTFYMLLPLASLIHRTLEIPALRDDTRPKILIVDDDPATLQLAQDYLEADYQVISTSTPAHVMQLARLVQPDVIVTDVMMPGMNGWDVLRALKSHEETAHIPVVVLSILDQKRMGQYMGAADYLLKPVGRERLLETLLKHRRSHP